MNNKVKYKNINDNLATALIFYVASILIEIFGGLRILGSAPSFIWVSLIFIHFISLVIFLLPTNIFRIIMASLFLLFHFGLTIANDILFNASGELVTISKLKLVNEATGAFDKTLIDWGDVILYAVVFLIAVAGMIVATKFIRKYVPTVKAFIAIVCLYALSLGGLCGLTAGIITEHDRYLYTSQYAITLAYSKFGHYGFYMQHVFNGIEFLSNRYKIETPKADEYLAYMKAGKDTPTTDFTGISEGNNVLLILAESLDPAGVDEYFTPNLYKLMYQDSMNMTEYYSENKTNMSEILSITGTGSRDSQLATTHDPEIAKFYGNFALPQLLKNEDSSYTTNYYHGLTEKFYYRNVTFNHLGFDNLIFAENQEAELKQFDKNIMGHEYDWTTDRFYDFVKDSHFASYNLETMIPSTGKFMSAYATITTHGTYTPRGSNKDNYEYLTSSANATHLTKMLDDMEAKGYHPRNILTPFLYYKAAMLDLDKTIKIIFDRLEETNNLDKTTVVVYSDHNAYYDNLSFILRGVDEDDVDKCQVPSFHMSCMIYDQKMIAKYKGEVSYTSGVQNDTFMSVMDIYPTVCDLLGLKWNTRVAYGETIFDGTPNVFMSFKDNRFIFDNNFYLYDGEVVRVGNHDIDKQYFEKLSDDIVYKLEVQEKLHRNLPIWNKMFD